MHRITFGIITSALAIGTASAQNAGYQMRPGDALKTQEGKYQGMTKITCLSSIIGVNAGQVTSSRTCDNGFTGISISDTNGNLIRRDTKEVSYGYSPHNFSGPSSAPRVGASWSGTFSNTRNGQPNGETTRQCSTVKSEPYNLPGFPGGGLIAYSVHCSWKWTEVRNPGVEDYKYIVIGGIPRIAEYSSMDNNFEFKILEFRTAGK